ncbi:MAG TPA: thiamine pyrophosphate-binding protein, partial [Burkholderiaceae bacterium]|nr:thiamine pyrophosphate-binding protein [Burkholderiaceae bacterium]
MTATSGHTVAELIARFLVARGVDRIFGLQGGHIQPIWDHLAQLNVRIVDVRDEGAAVHMAHAHAALSGRVGIAMATAGPGVTNCVTAMANAHLERVPVLLIGGCPPVPQDDLGPLQGIDHVAILQPVTRWSRTLRVADQIARDLDKAWAMADGDGNPPGPVYVEIPTNVLRETVPAAVVLHEHMAPKPRRVLKPDGTEVSRAATLLRAAKRPLVVTGRGARGCGAALTRLLDASGAVYLDTQESRGLVDPAHASVVGAMRGRAMLETDLAVIVGRKLDYQMGYGSPAVMPQAKFIRIADHADELRDNRRGEVEILADANLALQALAAEAAAGSRGVDVAWTGALRAEHVKRSAKHAENLSRAEAGKDGHMHPNRIFGALRQVLKPEAITIADGGDLLSFARTGL